MLVALADEGPFLLLLARPGSPGGDQSEWVIPIGEADGWSLDFSDGSNWDVDDRTSGAEVEVRVELLDAEPADFDPRYSEIVEVSSAGSAIIVGSGTEVEATAAQSVPYRVRLLTGDDREVTGLLVQSWPSAAQPTTVIRTMRTMRKEADRDATNGMSALEAAGIAAAARIGNDVDRAPGSRSLSGERGVAKASIVAPGEPAAHVDFFDQVYVWTPNPDRSIPRYKMTPWDPSDPSADWWMCAMKSPDQRDRITGWLGTIWTQPHTDNRPPDQSVLRWRWVRRTPPANARVKLGEMGEPVLPRDTVRIARFVQKPGPDPTTEITIEHRDVPIEWVGDLSAWWALQLAIHAGRQ